MRGVARAEGHHDPADYEAVLLAFSRLSHAVVVDGPPGGALEAAAETGTVLLQADSAAAYILDPTSNRLELTATYQMDVEVSRRSVPAEAAVRRCIETGTPVIVPNVASDRGKGFSALAKSGVASVLCVPLMAKDQRIGALAVMSRTLRAFSPSDIEVLSAIAEQAAFAAQRLKLYSNLFPEQKTEEIASSQAELIDLANRKIQELSIVNRVSEAIISTLDLTALLDLALDQCLTAVGASVGSIMLLDEDTRMLSIRAAKGLSREVIESASVTVGEGIAGWVAEHGRPVLVHDARTDARFRMMRYRDDITSAMSVPLKARGRVTGVLNVSTVEPGRRYGPREVEFLSTIANQVAIAIDNAGLYEGVERRSSELASLLDISGAITSTLDLHEVLALLAERLLGMARMDACALLVFDPERGRFRCLHGRGLTRRDRKSAYLDAALPIAAQVHSVGGPVCGDLGRDSPYTSAVAEAEGFRSVVAVPLTAAEGVVGAVAMFSRAQRKFAPNELGTLSTLGALAGVALHNALVYQHKYEIARSLQHELVPTVPLVAEGLEIGHKFLPAREVGGDYYDLIKVASGKVGIVIADVAGQSVAAAVYTSMGKHVLRAYALEHKSPADVLRRLNRVACDDVHPEVFISLFYGVFDSKKRVFRYASAGHEPPLIYRPDGSFASLRADGILIGIHPGAEYEEREVSLESGSIIVLFTDGVADSAAAKRKFTVDSVKQIVSADALKPAQELADNVCMRLAEIVGNRIQDDAALVVLKVL